MKKLFFSLIFLIFCLISFSAYADDNQVAILVSQPPEIWNPVAAGGGCDVCTSGLLFSWHMENTTDVKTGTPCGCSLGAVSPFSTTGTPTISISQYEDGSHSLYIPTASPTPSSYATFTINSEDIIQHAIGSMSIWAYVTLNEAGGGIVMAAGTVSSGFEIRTSPTSSVQFNIHYVAAGNDYNADTTISGGYALNTWYHLIAAWSYAAQGGNHLKICADTTTGTTNCGTNSTSFATWNGALANLYVGNYAADWTYREYLDNLQIYNYWQ